MNLVRTILVTSDVPVVILLVYTAVVYKALQGALKVFSWFVFFSAAVQLISLALWCLHINNLPLVHIYVPGVFFCLALYYKTVLGNSVNGNILSYTSWLFVAFSVANTLFVQSLFIFNSYALVVEAVLLIILSLFTFLFFLNDTVRDKGMPDRNSHAWINSGIFVYHLSSLLIYYFSNVTIFGATAAIRKYPWIFHSFFSIVMYCCFLIGLWKRSKVRD